jgi:hypothetical protein
MRPHNPFNRRDTENARAELAQDQQEAEMAIERYLRDRDCADAEPDEEDAHVEPRDRMHEAAS